MDIQSSNAARVQTATDIGSSTLGNEAMVGKSRTTGETVTVSSNASDITDALEELGMAVSGRAKVDLSKTKARQGTGTDLDALGRIAEYLDKLPNLPKDQQLRDLVAKFGQFEELFRRGGDGGGSLPTYEDLRAALEAYDGDVAHRFAALETLRATAAASGAPQAYVDMLDTLRAEMRTPALARDIVAGFAAAPEASRSAEALGGSPQDFRDAYRQMLRETPDAGRVFDALKGFSVTEKLEAVLDSFVKVAGADMASFGPSADPAHLGGVLVELTKLKQMRTVLDASGEALGRLGRMFPQTASDPARPGAVDLAGRLLSFASAPVASLQGAQRIVDGLGPEPPELGVAAVNLVRDLHAAIPDAILPPNQRQAQARVLMALSDQMVETEEAAYGN